MSLRFKLLPSAFFALVHVVGCSADPHSTAAALQQPTYAAEQKACVDKAVREDAGLASSRACRCGVQRRWQCPDIGGCTACAGGEP